MQRVARLEGPLVDGHLAPWLRSLAIEAATELGVDPEQVIAETTIILTEAAAAGALGSKKALEAFLAQQSSSPGGATTAGGKRVMAYAAATAGRAEEGRGFAGATSPHKQSDPGCPQAPPTVAPSIPG